jgi:Asp-tRNA(Asn)/Glu-tRNA(Gln) amidotransferase A subunit family amidase
MTLSGLGAFFRALQKIATDLRANRPLPTPKPVTSENMLLAIKKARIALPLAIAYIEANPGVVWASEDAIEALRALGAPIPDGANDAVESVHAILKDLNDVLPEIEFFVGAFRPAPIGIPGGISGARGHI